MILLPMILRPMILLQMTVFWMIVLSPIASPMPTLTSAGAVLAIHPRNTRGV